ncbi:MAG TPA: sensor histidine kinase [Anaerolineales bacterium]|nr:sensor histidine kinase [Anaerolineales bacterium]
MREIALHLLDIAENSVAAESKSISIHVHEDLLHDRLSAAVIDDGCGMDAATAQQVQDPFYTTRTTRNVGLGIPLLKLAAEQADGNFSLQSEPGKGAWVEAEFRHSHIDRMPLGDLPSTFLTLLISHPQIDWTFLYRVTDKNRKSRDFLFESAELKNALGDISLTEPEVLTFLRGTIEEGVEEVALQTVPA